MLIFAPSNPSRGMIYISGADNAQVDVYTTSGTLVMSNVDAGNAVDLSQLEQGIYMLKIVVDDKAVVNKKISILK